MQEEFRRLALGMPMDVFILGVYGRIMPADGDDTPTTRSIEKLCHPHGSQVHLNPRCVTQLPIDSCVMNPTPSNTIIQALYLAAVAQTVPSSRLTLPVLFPETV